VDVGLDVAQALWSTRIWFLAPAHVDYAKVVSPAVAKDYIWHAWIVLLMPCGSHVAGRPKAL
jgi:hypothetical protein